MDNFDFNIDLGDAFEAAVSEQDIEKKAAAIEHLAKAKAALLKAQQDAEKAKLEQEKLRSDMLIDRSIGIKDVLPLIPAFLTAAVGITTCAATIKSANTRAAADLAIADTTSQRKLQALQFWKKKEEDDLIDDKSLKATNELFR